IDQIDIRFIHPPECSVEVPCRLAVIFITRAEAYEIRTIRNKAPAVLRGDDSYFFIAILFKMRVILQPPLDDCKRLPWCIMFIFHTRSEDRRVGTEWADHSARLGKK